MSSNESSNNRVHSSILRRAPISWSSAWSTSRLTIRREHNFLGQSSAKRWMIETTLWGCRIRRKKESMSERDSFPWSRRTNQKEHMVLGLLSLRYQSTFQSTFHNIVMKLWRHILCIGDFLFHFKLNRSRIKLILISCVGMYLSSIRGSWSLDIAWKTVWHNFFRFFFFIVFFSFFLFQL